MGCLQGCQVGREANSAQTRTCQRPLALTGSRPFRRGGTRTIYRDHVGTFASKPVSNLVSSEAGPHSDNPAAIDHGNIELLSPPANINAGPECGAGTRGAHGVPIS